MKSIRSVGRKAARSARLSFPFSLPKNSVGFANHNIPNVITVVA